MPPVAYQYHLLHTIGSGKVMDPKEMTHMDVENKTKMDLVIRGEIVDTHVAIH